MDVTNSAVWFTVSFVLISAIAIKIAKGRIMFGSSRCTMPTPPVVDGISLIPLHQTGITLAASNFLGG